MMTISEARMAQVQLNDQLTVIVQQFETKTGLRVESIHIARVPAYASIEDHERTVITGVSAEVRL